MIYRICTAWKECTELFDGPVEVDETYIGGKEKNKHASKKHLHRYVTEFEGRHNVRSLDTIDQMCALALGMVGKRLRYKDLIR